MKPAAILYSLIIVGLLCLCFLLWPTTKGFIHYVQSVLAYPYAWALTENENMLFIHGISSGENFYHTTNPQAFLYFVYPPLFHLIAAGLIKLFGFTILIPRLISLVSFVSFIGLVFFFFKDRLKTVENGLVTLFLAGLAVSLSPYAQYYILTRADMLALALGFGSIFFMWQIISSNQTQNNQDKINRTRQLEYWLASGLAVAALFTKQSVFFPYILMILLFALAKNRKQWLIMMIGLAGATILSYLFLTSITHGGFGQSMLIASDVYGKHMRRTEHFLWLHRELVADYWPLLLSLLGLVGLSIYPMLRRKSPIPFTLLAMTAIYANVFITGGNRAAGENSFIPLLFGLLLAMKELYSFGHSPRLRPVSAGLFLLLSLLAVRNLQPHRLAYRTPTDQDRHGQERLIERIKSDQTSRWILGDRVDYAIFLAGKDSLIEASTHSLAVDWPSTKSYTTITEKTLVDRLKNNQIGTAVVTHTQFGHEDLRSYVESKGTAAETIRINYLETADLGHTVYRFSP